MVAGGLVPARLIPKKTNKDCLTPKYEAKMMKSTKLLSMVTIALVAGMMIVAGGCGDKNGENGKQNGTQGAAKTCTCQTGDGACELHGKKGTPKPKTGGGATKLKKVVLTIALPKAMFKGTPVPMNEPNIAKGRAKGQERPVIKVPEGSVNLALNKPVTSNEPLPVVGDLEMVTDGDKSGEDGHNVDIGFGKKWVQVDLGLIANIYGVSVWHYHGQARAYRDVIIEVADDEDFTQNVQMVFNSDHDNSYGKGIGEEMGYVETNEGRYMYCPKGTKGRYVRLHSQGNTSNDQNHYIEVEVYGIPIK